MIICPYCMNEAIYMDSKRIYGVSYGMVYACLRCDAYVGVHRGTYKPKGRLANKELRQWKIKAHASFDPLWMRKFEIEKNKNGKRYKKSTARSDGYRWLAQRLGLTENECHIGMFDIDLCKRVIAICMPYTEKLRRK